MPTPQYLIIIRHAHRDKDLGRETDNSLSPKGHEQADALQKYFREFFGKAQPAIYSSPKLRCVETVEPLGKKLGVPVKIEDCLNESASEADLRERLRAFEALVAKTNAEGMIACSHGDWIPAFVDRATGAWVELDKAGWIELEIEKNLTFKLRNIVQDVRKNLKLARR